MDHNLPIKAKTRKILEDTGVNLHELELGKGFLNPIPKA